MKPIVTVFWFRRDLRLEDNHGLYQALKSEHPVLPLFIFDRNILDRLEDKADRRVDFIHQALIELKSSLIKLGSNILIKYGNPQEVWKRLFEEYEIKNIFTNHDYEKYGITRDAEIKELATSFGADFKTFKDQSIFEKKELLSGSGTPYTVFTPYSRKWKEHFSKESMSSFETEKHFNNFFRTESEKFSVPALDEMGFKKTDMVFTKPKVDLDIIKSYKEQRDLPAIKGTTHLSVHLRFGTISIREAVREAQHGQETWLNELIWRDFYFNILANFPHINDGKAFRESYDKIEWRKNEEDFNAWCEGKTGFPIVDAGIRELNTTGFMHNRVRMIVASFLCKDLLLDWRWGEAYFAKKLNDFDFSANNGGWQWASGSGCDAAPYFRVFNPDSQTLKFDKDLKYIRKWVPEFQDLSYKPILDHSMARDRALRVYKEGLVG